MRIVRLNESLFNSSCVLVVVVMSVMVLLILIVLRMAVAGVMEDCGTDKFVAKFCDAVSERRVHGGACQWVCENKLKLSLCSNSPVHQLHDNFFLKSITGPMFAMRSGFHDNISTGYELHTTARPYGSTFIQSYARMRRTFRSILNEYLNQGTHNALLNSIKAPTQEPIPAQYMQSTSEILRDKRFVLSLLFYGTGERSEEPPGSATESIPAVSLDYTCAGLYQTFSLVNNTTPFTDILNRSASRWSLGTSINTFHLHEAILALLDIEETTTEHEHEGQFYMCNLNTSQLLLHNDCVKANQAESYMLSHTCTLKVLDISSIIFSRYEVESEMSGIQCNSDKQCRFHSCNGVCAPEGHCTLNSDTILSGLLQICRLIKSIETQILEEVAEETFRGRLYSIIDRCLDLRYYPHGAPHHLVSAYNNLFQELKLCFIDLHDAKQYKLTNHVEMVAARKEAEKMAAKNKVKATQVAVPKEKQLT